MGIRTYMYICGGGFAVTNELPGKRNNGGPVSIGFIPPPSFCLFKGFHNDR